MGLLDRLIGHADASQTSALVLRFLGEGEQILAGFKFMRDEIVVTNRGIFSVDVQGITGSKKEYKYFPIKAMKYVSYESAGTFDMDADIKIGVDGNSSAANGVSFPVPLSFKIPRAQAAQGEHFFRVMKAALDGLISGDLASLPSAYAAPESAPQRATDASCRCGGAISPGETYCSTCGATL